MRVFLLSANTLKLITGSAGRTNHSLLTFQLTIGIVYFFTEDCHLQGFIWFLIRLSLKIDSKLLSQRRKQHKRYEIGSIWSSQKVRKFWHIEQTTKLRILCFDPLIIKINYCCSTHVFSPLSFFCSWIFWSSQIFLVLLYHDIRRSRFWWLGPTIDHKFNIVPPFFR